LDAYNVASEIEVEMCKVVIKDGSVTTTLRFKNPTKFMLRLGSVWEELYLNGWSNFVGEGFLWVPYWNSYKMPPYCEVFLNVTVTATYIPNLPSSGIWCAKITFWVYDVPLIEWGARFVRFVKYS